MKQKFVTNLVLIILLNLLIKPLWIFGIDRHVQVITGVDVFGTYSTLLSMSFLLNILLDFGITSFNNRNISQNHQLLRKNFSNLVALKLILAFIYAVVVFSLALILGYEKERYAILGLLVLNQFLTSFTLYLRSNIAGMQMHTANSLISVLDKALMIVFCAVLIWGGISDQPFRIEWFVYAQTAAYVLTALICFGIVLYKSRFPRFKFDRLFFFVILKQSFPYALLVLFMSSYTRIDFIIIDKILGDTGAAQAGIYNHGFRLFDAANQFALLFAVLLFPMFSKMLKERQSIVGLTRLSSLLLFIPSIAFAIASMFYRNEIMVLMEYEEVLVSASIYSLLMFAFLGMAGTIIYGTLLTANGNLRILNILSGIAVAINVVLNLILVPRYHALGAAISAVITQGFVGLSQYIVASRKFRFGFDPKLLFKSSVYILGVLGLGLGSTQIDYIWWVRFLGVLAASIILAMALNIIDLRSMIKLILNGDSLKDKLSKPNQVKE